jgi:hypothetical protein
VEDADIGGTENTILENETSCVGAAAGSKTD